MGKLYNSKNNYDDFDIGYDNGYYNGYDNNQYISDGHDYFNSEYDYVNNEYNNSGFQRNDQVYFENLSDYGQYYPQDASIYDISNKINNTLTQDLEYDMYANNGYADSSRYAGNYDYNTTPQEFYQRHNYINQMALPDDIQFEDTYVVSNQYFDDDEEKLISAKDILSLLICVMFAFVLAYVITTYVAQHTQVDGTSMLYNFQDEDILIVDKISYRFSDPKRFDVIIFPTKKNVYYIKRIIGLPGETISIKSNGDIYINDILLNETYGSEVIEKFGTNSDMTLGEGEYFVLGDNRNHSEDSRYANIGEIHREDIIGKAIFRIWPMDSFGLIDHSVNARLRQGDTSIIQQQ